jgi:hypothetical protein
VFAKTANGEIDFTDPNGGVLVGSHPVRGEDRIHIELDTERLQTRLSGDFLGINVGPSPNSNPFQDHGAAFATLDYDPALGFSPPTLTLRYEALAPSCDLNGDLACDISDLDTLYQDANVSSNSVVDWLEAASTATGRTLQQGDTDLDGDVDFADFLQFSDNFAAENATWGLGDFDGDQHVGFADFLVLSDNFGDSSIAATVPEPQSLLLMLVTCVATAGTRRRGRRL